MSREALGELSGTGTAAIAAIEEGRGDPTWGYIRRLASALNVSLESLAELAEDSEKETGQEAPKGDPE